jgi:hypothetical protein
MQQNCSVTNQYELMRTVAKGEIHNILNNLPRSLILIHFHFGRAVSKLLAIRPVVAEITDLIERCGTLRRAKAERAWLFPGTYCRERRGDSGNGEQFGQCKTPPDAFTHHINVTDAAVSTKSRWRLLLLKARGELAILGRALRWPRQWNS